MGGGDTRGTIGLAAPAPPGGVRVTLVSDDADVTVPASVTISAGSTEASFDIKTLPVVGAKDVRVTATFSGSALKQAGASALVFVIRLLPPPQSGVPAPALTAIAPASGTQGTSVSVTLTGTQLQHNPTVHVTGSGITVSNLSASGSTSLTATFTIAAGAATGARTVTVTTAGGTTGGQAFTVNAAPPPPTPAPTLTSVSPSSAPQGATVAVTLTGTNFTTGASVQISGSGVTVSNVAVAGSTSITATFAISAGAVTGARSVTIATPGGTSGGQAFTINAAAPSPSPAPTLTGISPASGVQGTTVDVTLTGTNFTTGATVSVGAGPGVTVSNVAVVSSTSITATFGIASSAPAGTRTVHVTTSAGATDVQFFSVTASIPPPPTLTGISPGSGVQGASIDVTLTGTNFVSGATVQLSGAGITVSDVTTAAATTITARFAIASGAAAGARTVTVTTAGGTSSGQTFTITAPASPPPTLTGITPGAGVQGTSVNVTLTGTNFVSPASIAIGPAPGTSGVTASSVTVVNSTTITATFAVGAGASPGVRVVSVTTPDGTTAQEQIFTVTAAESQAPTITGLKIDDGWSEYPAEALQGATDWILIVSGSRLTSATTMNFSGSGISIREVATHASGLRVVFSVAADAPTGARTVTATNTNGTSNAQTFTVLQAPTITGISPSSGRRPASGQTTVNFTLTGVNFLHDPTGITITICCNGVTGGGTRVNNTTITGSINISSSATEGAKTIRVTTRGVHSNTIEFTVLPPLDALIGFGLLRLR